MKVLLSTIVAILAMANLFVFYEVVKTAYVPVPIVQSVQYKQDPELIEVLYSLGAEHTNFSLAYNDELPFGATGRYSAEGLEVARVNDPEKLKRLLAHEYLHHVWYSHTTPEKKRELENELFSIYKNDPATQNRMIRYIELDLLSATELFSIYCTEVNDSYILSIVDECNKYIDRSTLTLLR